MMGLQNSRVIWHFDADDHELDRMAKALSHGQPWKCVSFSSYERISGAINQLTDQSMKPPIFAGDTISLRKFDSKPGIAQVLAEKSPFTICFHFGSSPTNPADREEIERRFVKHFNKSQRMDLISEMEACWSNWNIPEVRAFREFVASGQFENPEVAYFPHGDLMLNAYDIHLEMVVGSPLGIEQRAVWKAIFELNLELEGQVALGN